MAATIGEIAGELRAVSAGEATDESRVVRAGEEAGESARSASSASVSDAAAASRPAYISSSKSSASLSAAAMETLAIVAYTQPVTRAGVASVRGVNSDSPLAQLDARAIALQLLAQGHEGRLHRTGLALFSSCTSG